MTEMPDEIKSLHYRGEVFVLSRKAETVIIEHPETSRFLKLDFVSKYVFVPGVSENHLQARLDAFVDEIKDRIPVAKEEAKQTFNVLMALDDTVDPPEATDD